ncbi:E3 ubiquitin- ligase TRIM39-like protein [Labeo rohita]|uniref:E3 ubiquitin-ligase TRIM39-like protein n=1 Tax=Labeo rohita TaxID=84645 RepID=A0A498N0R6_LABRO|nr:E3 ubiquitin- ligase TRIM39-like protein [Labeo rohita]
MCSRSKKGRGEGILFLISLKAKLGQQSKNGVCHSNTERLTVLCLKSNGRIFTNTTEAKRGQEKTKVMKIQADVQQMIQDRTKKIQDIKHSAELRKSYPSMCKPFNTKQWPDISVNTPVCFDIFLKRSKEQWQNLYLHHQNKERPGDRAWKDIHTEVMKIQADVQQMIQDRMKKIQDIKHSAELRKSYPSMCKPFNTKQWPDISVNTPVSLNTIRAALTQLQQTLDDKLSQTGN